ncbi:staphyloferrin B biosynthesis protein SbnC [Staphylococcus lutrae]|uniref:Siderophore biosynthesis protein SbnC n=1 Tax=Staphylococcus lutrae TaxID=155085 RepID=A0AAC9WJE1_9STAP|nr:staphyloferrin B biosynthesis protein SbnC [Staphylococcus lutrae]ARJ51180.1 siderophore biosynthesis protein SbnC [Staphylococcus lutrae]PNZ39424.1 siderophore biosynthesis protein SbnC [Staphylococcus lutrae]
MSTYEESFKQRAHRHILKDLVDALIFEDIGGIVSASQSMRLGQQCYLRYEKQDTVLLIPVYQSGLNMYRFNGDAVECVEAEVCRPLQAVAFWQQFITMNADIATEWEHQRVTAGLAVAIEQLTDQYVHFSPSEDTFIYSEQLASLKDRPFHPLAKEKRGLTPEDYQCYQSEYYRPFAVRTVAVKKTHVLHSATATTQCYETFWGTALEESRQVLSARGYDAEAYLIFPVHPWQYAHVIPQQFESEIEQGIVVLLDMHVGAYVSSSSMRTLLPTEPSMVHLKVPFSMQSLGALRLTPTRYMKNGEAGEGLLREITARDTLLHESVQLCDETVWWSFINEKRDIFQDQSGHLTMQFRYYPESMADNTIVVSMAALAAHDRGLYQRILGTPEPTTSQLLHLFEQLSLQFLKMALGFIKYGVLPEIHGQNVLVSFRDGQVTHFILRDHDTVRIFPKWLEKNGLEQPKYIVRKDTPNTLLNKAIERFFAYFQTLAVSVNLYAIVDALVDVFNISEMTLMTLVRQKMHNAIGDIDWLPGQYEEVVRIIFQQETWPFKRILLPLLYQRSDGGGSMPSSLSRVPNPMKVTHDSTTHLAT